MPQPASLQSRHILLATCRPGVPPLVQHHPRGGWVDPGLGLCGRGWGSCCCCCAQHHPAMQPASMGCMGCMGCSQPQPPVHAEQQARAIGRPLVTLLCEHVHLCCLAGYQARQHHAEGEGGGSPTCACVSCKHPPYTTGLRRQHSQSWVYASSLQDQTICLHARSPIMQVMKRPGQTLVSVLAKLTVGGSWGFAEACCWLGFLGQVWT